MKGNAGFTFLEILVVVVIIAILATVVGVNVARHPGRARVTAATAQIVVFRTALQSYRMELGRYPTQEQGLRALCERPTVAPIPENYPEEGFLDSRHVPKDPWGRDYVYLAPGRRQGDAHEIICYGADGEPGGAGEDADITSAEM